MLRRLLKIFLLLLALIIGLLLVAFFYHPKALRNPAAIAAHETRMWKAYYEEDKIALGRELVLLLRQQFGISLKDAIVIAKDLAEASMSFRGASRDEYPKALMGLETAYARIKESTKAKWDSREAAAAELQWWVDRRTSSRSSEEVVGQSISNLYRVLYGSTNPDIEEAGLLRARAAELRDSGGHNADWPRIQSILEDSYGSLVKGTSKR